MGDELERGPFGQNLSLLVHRLPRAADGADFDWEIERGFHLQILAESLFELHLRPRTRSDGEPRLPLLSGDIAPGVCRLLLWQKRPKDEQGWSEFAAALAGNWRAGIILSNSCERKTAVTSFLSRRKHWSGVECPVVQVFQDSPPATFFTVEKNLFALGRVGRRMERNSKLRKILPW